MATTARRVRVKDLVTLQQAAQVMELEQSTLYQLRTRHGSAFPAPVWKGGRIALYDLAELRTWYAKLHAKAGAK